MLRAVNPTPPTGSALTNESEDELFARALCTRSLGELGSVLLPESACATDDAVRVLDSCVKAPKPRETLVLRALRKVYSSAVYDNATIDRVATGLHALATKLPSGSKAGDAAAGLLLLFAHGLGQMLPSSVATTPAPSAACDSPLIVFLGFAGGTPADLQKYSEKIYGDDHEVLHVCASEIPAVYNHNLDVVLAKVGASSRPYVAHLFSKAGFLTLARLAERVGPDKHLLPTGVVWDSAPGSLIDYDEFVAGTWSSAELLLSRATKAAAAGGTAPAAGGALSGSGFGATGSALTAEIDYQREQAKKYLASGKPLLWDFDDLLEYAEGDIAPVFNKHLSGEHPPWALIDTYSKCCRLPMREYLLCSRVTKMSATTNVFEPCSMTTEYDLPYNGELSEGGQIPWAVLVESGQCDLMLISYLGVDFQNKGIRSYRLLDTTLTFYGVAQEGQTLSYDISIQSFAKQEGNVTMFFFSYNCYVDGKLLIEMRNGVAGFFTKAELDAGKGVVWTVGELKMRQRARDNKKDPSKCLVCPASKMSYTEADMRRLSEAGHVAGTWGEVMGPTAGGVQYKLCARKMLMIDRVTHIMPRGGIHGLGLLIGEKDLERDHWYFPCHFKNDQVMAGSLVSDGCSQLLKLYMIHMGLHTAVHGVVFTPVHKQPNKVRCRGQISPHKGKLVYWVEINELGFDATTGYPYAKADVNIIDINYENGQTFDCPTDASLLEKLEAYGKGDMAHKICVDFRGVALQMEGSPTASHPTMPGSGVSGGPSTVTTTSAAARSAPATTAAAPAAFSAEARARMDALLSSSEYAPAVRDSYAPMHSLNPFPHAEQTPHHLFLHSPTDKVCSPAAIQTYANAVSASTPAVPHGSCTSVSVKGTHCDGLFWSADEYTSAVKGLVAKVAAARSIPAPAAPVAAAAAPGISAEAATKCVLDVLASKTGYEVDMIEMDMALETELGVDSIKRVEILSDVQRELGVEAQDVAALSRTQTVGEVVDAMIAEIKNAGS